MTSNKLYYPKDSPRDLLFEEHHTYNRPNIFSGEGIYEWNIDGRSKYEMMNLFQEMGIASIAYKAKRLHDKEACIYYLLVLMKH